MVYYFKITLLESQTISQLLIGFVHSNLNDVQIFKDKNVDRN